jgi:hypothetical protein
MAEAAKSTHYGMRFCVARDSKGDSMPVTTTALKPMPSIVPADVPLMSDDECLRRLAKAVEEHDDKDLDEVALLIGRLAVAIE